MRRCLPTAIAVLLVLAPAAAGQAPAPSKGDPGGAEFDLPPQRLAAVTFAVAPGTVRSGTPVTVRLRLEGIPNRARARIRLTRKDGREAIGGIDLGRVRTHRTVTQRWRPLVPAGDYVARLEVARLGSRDGTVVPVTVMPKPKPPPPPVVPTGSGVFPLAGSDWSFGGEDARFGAGRRGHTHQGQDITAPSGTPVLSPVPGTVYERAVQRGGAGHYLVVRGADGTDYVFMHLVADSERVEEGDAVAEAQQIAQVGSTGSSGGPHLHFEIWPDGWYAEGSEPIDPLPTLQAWL